MVDQVPPQSPTEPPPGGPSAPQLTGISDNDRLMAALAYFLWFIGAGIILLTEESKRNTFLRYHAVQALGLSVVLSAYTVVLVAISFIICCFWIAVLAAPAVSIYYAYMAYQGRYFKIPILSHLLMDEGWLRP